MVITSVFCILTCIFKSLILQSVGNELNNVIRPYNELTSIHLASNIIEHCSKEENIIMIVDPKRDDGNDHCHLSSSSFALIYLFGYDSIAITSENKRFKKVYQLNQTHVGKHDYPISNVVISVPSNSALTVALEQMRDSIWWNHRARYLIIINNNTRNNCPILDSFTIIFWNFKLINVVFLCENANGVFELYSFNPYANFFPNFWTKVESHQIQDQNWTLLKALIPKSKVLTTLDDSRFCHNLYFDKIQNLNGYPVKAAIIRQPILIEKVEATRHINSNHASMIVKEMLKYMNANVTVKIYNTSGFFDGKGKPHDILEDILSGTIDLTMNAYFLRDFWKQESYPFTAAKLKIVSLKSPQTFLNRIPKILNPEACFMVMLGSICIPLTLKYVLQRPLSLAGLDFIRMLVGNSVSRVPDELSKRVFFITFTIFTLVINAFISSCFDAIQTAPGYSFSVDSAKDLINSNFPIFGIQLHKELFEVEIRNRYQYMTNISECINKLFTGQQVACIHLSPGWDFFVQEGPTIHVSHSHLVERSSSIVLAEDSPFQSRFDKILMRLSEGGFVSLFFDRIASNAKRNYIDISLNEMSLDIENIFMGLFVIIIGHVISIAVFLVEIIIKRF